MTHEEEYYYPSKKSFMSSMSSSVIFTGSCSSSCKWFDWFLPWKFSTMEVFYHDVMYQVQRSFFSNCLVLFPVACIIWYIEMTGPKSVMLEWITWFSVPGPVHCLCPCLTLTVPNYGSYFMLGSTPLCPLSTKYVKHIIHRHTAHD